MPRTKAEIGAVGLPIMSGFLSLDPNRRLRGTASVSVYREMASDEPAASAFLSACFNLLRTDLHVEPGGTRDNDKRAADFLEQCLNDMRDDAASQLRQLYSMVWAGWSLSELVYKRRTPNLSRYTDGRVGWAAWALRRQESLYKWDIDPQTGDVQTFIQRPAPDYKERRIPFTKVVHVTADDSEGSPEGRSALRGMYRQWYFVRNVELLLGIALERFGTGIPVLEANEHANRGDYETYKTVFDDIFAAIRQNEEAGIATPPGYAFRFAPSPGLNAQDYLDTIQRMRTWMLATVLADFIALGTQGGSYALGKDKTEIFLLALNGYQERVVAALNRQAVPWLFRYNDFGTLTDIPRLALPAVKKYDLDALGSFAQALHGIGGLHVTPEDEAHFRKISDLVDIDAAALRGLFTAQPQQQEGQPPNEPTDPQPSTDGGTADQPATVDDNAEEDV